MSGRQGKHGHRDRIDALIAAGKTDEEIAAETGCSLQWVGRVRRGRLPPSMPAQHTFNTERDRIEQGIAREHSDERIAADERVTVERVRAVRREMNAAVAGTERQPRKARP